MSKDLEVLLRTTYLGALMMMVSRNTLKYRGHTAETERGEKRHQTLGLQKNNKKEEAEEKRFIKKAEKQNNRKTVKT